MPIAEFESLLELLMCLFDVATIHLTASVVRQNTTLAYAEVVPIGAHISETP